MEEEKHEDEHQYTYEEDGFDEEMLIAELEFYLKEFNHIKMLYNLNNNLTVEFDNGQVFRYTIKKIKDCDARHK